MNAPQITLFHHKHGTSYGICPAGVDPVDFWKEQDDHDPNDESEEIESIPLPQPYASAPELLEALKEMLIANHGLPANPSDESDPVCRVAIEKARAIIAKAKQ